MYPQTSVPNTQHSVWYAHTILVNNVEIGSCQSISLDESRPTERIREIFFNQGPYTKEIVWGGADISITLNQTELYKQSLLQAVGQGVFALEDIWAPIDVVEVRTDPNGNTRTLQYLNCVPNSHSRGVDLGGSIRIDASITMDVTRVYGFVS